MIYYYNILIYSIRFYCNGNGSKSGLNVLKNKKRIRINATNNIGFGCVHGAKTIPARLPVR